MNTQPATTQRRLSPFNDLDAVFVLSLVFYFIYYAHNNIWHRLLYPFSSVSEVLLVMLIFIYVGGVMLRTSVRWMHLGKTLAWSSLVLIIFFSLFLTTIILVSERSRQNEIIPLHDGAVQTEDAYNFLLQGKNPYSETYYAASLARSWSVIWPGIVNPALEHYAYMPATLLIGGAMGALENALFGFQDLRLLLMVAVLACLYLFYLLLRRQPSLPLILIIFLFNPIFYPFLLEGRNDLLPFTFILATIVALVKNKKILAGILFGVALAFKQFSWFVLPFLILYLARPNMGAVKKRLQSLWPWLLPTLFVFLAFVLPFLIWDFRAFIDDTIQYTAGTTSLSYPVSGYGFSSLLLTFKLIGAKTNFPFGLIMLPVAILLLYFLGKKVWREQTLSTAVLCSAIFLAVTSFFTRYLNDSHIAFVSYLLIMWFALRLYESEKNKPEQDVAGRQLNS